MLHTWSHCLLTLKQLSTKAKLTTDVSFSDDGDYKAHQKMLLGQEGMLN